VPPVPSPGHPGSGPDPGASAGPPAADRDALATTDATPEARAGADAGAGPGPESGAGRGSRVRRWVDQGRQWTDLERERVGHALEERRHTSTVIGAGFDIRELDVHVGGGILAGAVAFRMFLFLVPFVYIVFSLVGLTARTLSEDPAVLARTVGITGVLASAVVSGQHVSPLSQVILLAGATFALFLTANSLAKTLYVVHWLVWRAGRAKPAALRAVGATVGIALAMSVVGVLANTLRANLGIAGSLLVLVGVTAIAFGLWWWVSWKLPHAPMSPRGLIPGAVFVALGADVMHAFTTYWIGPYVSRKSSTYGAVGIALAVLLWVYIFGRIVVGSAGINVTLWRRQSGTVAEEPGDPGPPVVPEGQAAYEEPDPAGG